MRAKIEPWDVRFLLLSPKEERAMWLKVMEDYPYGMAVNCRHMPSLERTPALRKLIEDGLIIRVRENRQWGKQYRKSTSKRTTLKLPEKTIPAV